MLPSCARNPLQTHTFVFFFLWVYQYSSVRTSDSPSPLRLLPATFSSVYPPAPHLFLPSSSPLLPFPVRSTVFREGFNFFFFKERGDGKGGEGLKWEGCLFIRAASSRLHVATKTTARPAEGKRTASGHRSLHPRDTPSDRPPARHNRRPQLPSPRPQTQVRERYMA